MNPATARRAALDRGFQRIQRVRVRVGISLGRRIRGQKVKMFSLDGMNFPLRFRCLGLLLARDNGGKFQSPELVAFGQSDPHSFARSRRIDLGKVMARGTGATGISMESLVHRGI